MISQEDYEKLKPLISMGTLFEGREEFFIFISRFLKERFPTTIFVAFSLPEFKVSQKNIDQTVRILWNRDSWNSNVDEILKKTFSESDEIPEDLSVIRHVEDRFHQLLLLGKESGQAVFFYLEWDNSYKDLAELFTTYFMKSFALYNNWSALEKSTHLIHVDDVTALYNQRKLKKDLDEIIDKFHEHKRGFVVLFIDIDHFKHVNDGHGHLVGTQLLKDLAIILKTTLRESDLVYRYGGDEFVMIVPDAGESEARIIGKRILHNVREKTFEAGDKNKERFKLSVSIGVARFPEDAKNRLDVLAFADQMMYYAKDHGRGQVCLAGELFNR